MTTNPIPPGWTQEWPHKADAGDEYYFVHRADRDEAVIMGFSMGKAWLNGVAYEPSELRSHLFLGPLKPADTARLMRLEKVIRAEIHRQCAHCKNGLSWTEDGRAHYGYAHQGVVGIVTCTASRELRTALEE